MNLETRLQLDNRLSGYNRRSGDDQFLFPRRRILEPAHKSDDRGCNRQQNAELRGPDSRGFILPRHRVADGLYEKIMAAVSDRRRPD